MSARVLVLRLAGCVLLLAGAVALAPLGMVALVAVALAAAVVWDIDRNRAVVRALLGLGLMVVAMVTVTSSRGMFPVVTLAVAAVVWMLVVFDPLVGYRRAGHGDGSSRP